MIDIDAIESATRAVIAGPSAEKHPDPVMRNMGRLEWMDVCNKYRDVANPAAILELCAEVRALRKDKERLDSGCIMTTDYDEFGDKTRTERRGNNLRQMIDDAMEEARK